jgi:hypothetical protein
MQAAAGGCITWIDFLALKIEKDCNIRKESKNSFSSPL